LRFVAWSKALCFDCRKKAPGRGYYVCAQKQCLEKAWKAGFKRASRGQIRVEGEFETYVIEQILAGLWQRYRECLLVGRQNRSLIVSTQAVESAARDNSLASYVLASDASASTRQKYEANAKRKGLAVLGLLDKESLGRLLGKGEKSVLGWKDGSAYDEFTEIEQSIKRLSLEFGLLTGLELAKSASSC
jgi:predicted RNA-binding protein YlxR (DUF448 family)